MASHAASLGVVNLYGSDGANLRLLHIEETARY